MFAFENLINIMHFLFEFLAMHLIVKIVVLILLLFVVSKSNKFMNRTLANYNHFIFRFECLREFCFFG